MADPHHADSPDNYVHGSQSIDEQRSTFKGFISLAKWGSLMLAAVILWLMLWFQPGGSFIAGAISAGVVVVAGYFLLKSKPSH